MKLRDFIVVAVVLDLLFGVFLFGLLGGFAGGILLPERLKSKIVKTCSQFTLITPVAKEGDSNGECDAVEAEKNIFKEIMDDQKSRLEATIQNFGENIDDGKNEYDESVRRYWARSGQPIPTK